MKLYILNKIDCTTHLVETIAVEEVTTTDEHAFSLITDHLLTDLEKEDMKNYQVIIENKTTYHVYLRSEGFLYNSKELKFIYQIEFFKDE